MKRYNIQILGLTQIRLSEMAEYNFPSDDNFTLVQMTDKQEKVRNLVELTYAKYHQLCSDIEKEHNDKVQNQIKECHYHPELCPYGGGEIQNKDALLSLTRYMAGNRSGVRSRPRSDCSEIKYIIYYLLYSAFASFCHYLERTGAMERS